MTLRKEKLEAIRSSLFERREALASDLRQATQSLLSEDEVHADVVDQAAADADRTLSMHMKNREREILFQIDAALKRVDEGSFGDCERCDESISEGRLMAFPFTTLCIDCKAELESEEHRFPGRA